MCEQRDIPLEEQEELEKILTSLKQGDIIAINKVISLYDPAFTNHNEAYDPLANNSKIQEPMEGEDDMLYTMTVDIPFGYCVVVSQDCDIEREYDLEPYLMVAPLIEVEEGIYRNAREGINSSRFFAYPKFEN